VINLFLSIFWAFYSLRLRRLWRSEDWYKKRQQELFVSQARRFRNTAVELGGLLIKLGQFFSTRVDVLPQAVTRELAGLQDEVQPVPFAELRREAEAEFGRPLEEIYEYLDETPLASASLGQVHCGRLRARPEGPLGVPGERPGPTVAVKIQRPAIEKLVETDLKALGRIIELIKAWTDWEKFADIDAIYNEFSATVHEELDYIHEGHNAETIARNLAGDPEVIIPRIFWEHTTRRVLTMEFEEGIKITDASGLERAGVNRHNLARKLLQIYVRQILVDGFFHADPHPGNLFVTPAGRIILIDFGMVGVIPRPLREDLVQLARSMIQRDYGQVVTLLKKVGFVRQSADPEVLAGAIGVFIEQMLGKGDELFGGDLKATLESMETLLYEQPFQIPAKFTFLGRALGTLYGLCIGLDPEIDFLDEARPYLAEFTNMNIKLWDIVKEKGAAIGNALVELPPLAERVLRKAERGDLHINVTMQSLNEAFTANTSAINRLTLVLAFGFTLGTSAYLLVNRLTLEARYGFAASGLLLLVLLLKNRGAPPSGALRRGHVPHPPPVIRGRRNG
jgi:predicted unusual protein kinase regulating ubiquinone biosynthesis (AarF/ABC1/UbiB family)